MYLDKQCVFFVFSDKVTCCVSEILWCFFPPFIHYFYKLAIIRLM